MNTKTALLSVYHKEGIVEFAQELVKFGWQIIASGGTAKVLAEARVPAVRDVASLVGGGAILGHRVVTLSREIHAGLLARNTPGDLAELEKLGVPYIDLVCVDLYPLEEEVQRAESTRESILEKTDIGGPTMIRSAAKGGRIVVCDPDDRMPVLNALKQEAMTPFFRDALAAKGEFVASKYSLVSAGNRRSKGFYAGILGEKKIECVYGENAWQTPAAFYKTQTNDPLALDEFQLAIGSDPSYNLLCFLDRGLQTITHLAAAFDIHQPEFGVPYIAIGTKHGNPCGAAIDFSEAVAIRHMLRGDQLAIHGGFVIVNFPITEELAEELLTHGMTNGERRLLDGVAAPNVT